MLVPLFSNWEMRARNGSTVLYRLGVGMYTCNSTVCFYVLLFVYNTWFHRSPKHFGWLHCAIAWCGDTVYFCVLLFVCNTWRCCSWQCGAISKWEMLARNGVLSEVGDQESPQLLLCLLSSEQSSSASTVCNCIHSNVQNLARIRCSINFSSPPWSMIIPNRYFHVPQISPCISSWQHHDFLSPGSFPFSGAN